jgi:hypothetical protein
LTIVIDAALAGAVAMMTAARTAVPDRIARRAGAKSMRVLFRLAVFIVVLIGWWLVGGFIRLS